MVGCLARNRVLVLTALPQEVYRHEMDLNDKDAALLRALVHDAYLRSDSAKELEIVHEMLKVAETVLANGSATPEDHRRARDLLHPSAINLYLD
jgi:hypothetical protein